MSPRGANRAAWALWSAAVACVAIYLVFAVFDRRAVLADTYGFHVYRAVDILVAVGFGSTGLVVVLRRPANPVGWMWLAGGTSGALRLSTRGYAVHALLVHPGSLPGAR